MSFQIKKLTDKGKILRFLERDRVYAAYAIGDLEPCLFPLCRWFGVEEDGELRSLALLFGGLEPDALLTFGASEGLALILGSALKPERAYFSCRREHLPVVEAFYALDGPAMMVRMVLTDFHPVPGPVLRLDLSHLRALEGLYRFGGGDAFRPYQLAQGVFYGVEVRGRLVAVAGTHLISPAYGVAAVGNVFTHPAYRRRGYAIACTSAVVEEILAEGIGTIVLNVDERNVQAMRIYRKLGFREHCRFVEAIGVRC
jgi:ribosomal protein S18 acetylase RimI-like enzyme